MTGQLIFQLILQTFQSFITNQTLFCRVTFPETLDLNPFIDSADTLSGQENNCQENNTKLDNGVLPDECSPCDGNSVENNHGNDEPNNDEGLKNKLQKLKKMNEFLID